MIDEISKSSEAQRKVLYVTTTGGTMSFFTSLVSDLIARNVSVDIATNDRFSHVSNLYVEMGCKIYTIDCVRSPFKSDNLHAIKQISKLVESGFYDMVHCHTPIAAACTRIACSMQKKHSPKVIYTAHGFHFYKGAPLKNWLLYFPVEWICSWATDTLVCINLEDYTRALKHLHARKTVYVPGVGVDMHRFEGVNRMQVRRELQLESDEILLLSVGELNQNKNHQIVLKALPNLPENVHYAIAGSGGQADELKTLANKLGVAQRFHLLGHRGDIPEVMAAADVYILPSLREGLNVSLMEAMASRLPCVCGRIRGNVDLIDESGGVLCNPKSVKSVQAAIKDILNSDLYTMGANNHKRVKEFRREVVNSMMFTSVYGLC